MRSTPSPRLIGFRNSGTRPDFTVPVRDLFFYGHIDTVKVSEWHGAIDSFNTLKKYVYSL